MDKIYFAKVKPKGVIPSKRDEDGCYDVYPCFDEDYIILKPGDIYKFPTGIASVCPKGYRFGVRERGSTGTIGMATRAGQIDSGYRGEWFIPINNTSNIQVMISKFETKTHEIILNGENTIVYPYSKAIAQVALEEVPDVEVTEITYDELITIDSERGTGCLGSSTK